MKIFWKFYALFCITNNNWSILLDRKLNVSGKCMKTAKRELKGIYSMKLLLVGDGEYRCTHYRAIQVLGIKLPARLTCKVSSPILFGFLEGCFMKGG